jgi:hypothetical protein
MSYDRRIELIHIILSRTEGKVYQGPFKGMKVLPKWSWGDGDVGGKVLGLYECELFPAIEKVIESKPDLILNIGCAEGFYGIGLALRTGQRTVLFDLMDSAIGIARENAQINNVNKIMFSTDCTVPIYRTYLDGAKSPFIFMDCEGAEKELLDLEVIPELNKTSVIVESHDCNIPGLTELLLSRFNDTHNIEIISQGSKNPYLDITQDFSDWDKMLLCCEFRPSTMKWLYLTPKK